jgi:hypothetical protein
MSNGPTALYDKSAMQLFSREEARWFTHFFRGVITPVFLIESISNLAKQFSDNRDPSKVVAAMAAKAQDLGSLPNVAHTELIEMNMLGYPVEMRGVPLLGGGKRLQNAKGEWGVFFEESPEKKALHRWRAGKFGDAEHERAVSWRETTKGIDLQPLVRAMKLSKKQRADLGGAGLVELKSAVDLFLEDSNSQFRTLHSAMEAFDLSQRDQVLVKRRWTEAGRPPFRHFAPYASYSLHLTMTFLLGVSLGRIPERPTNIIDLQYLYYLPFCQVFTSGDKFHRDLAPLFMGRGQLFIWAQDLKASLREFVTYYEGHQEEIRKQGSMRFARFPPLEMDSVIHAIYDKLRPRWREEALVPEEPITPEESARIMAEIRPMIEAFEKAAGGKSPFEK